MKKAFAVLVILLLGFSVASAENLGPFRELGLGYTSITRDIDFDGDVTEEAEVTLIMVNGTIEGPKGIDFMLSLGVGSMDIGDIDITFDGVPYTVATSGDFSGGYSYALRAKADYRIAELMDRDVGIDLTGGVLYFRTGSDDRTISLPVVDGTLSMSGTWMELQFGAKATWEGAGRLKPYAGAELSIVDGDITGDESIGQLSGSASESFDSPDLLGAFAGIDYTAADNLKVGCQAKFMSQTSFAVAVTYLF